MVSLNRAVPQPMVIKYRGIFDLDGLYRTMVEWFEYQGYEMNEKAYKHKVPNPAGAEQEISWVCWRKVNAYVKYWMIIYFHIWELKEVEVIKDGKKKKMTSARMKINFDGRVELDWQNMFAGNRFLVEVQHWMNKYVLHKKITGHWEDELYYRMHKLFYVTKEFLNMETVHNASAHRY